jgi:propanol-preferring alcohol dehydrogenase
MRAMVLHSTQRSLVETNMPMPEVQAGDVLVHVSACAVCRTDLHVIDGELPNPKLPLIPGHEIVGRIVALGTGVDGFALGERVGIPWLGWTCGECRFCRSDRENLCERARFTSYTLDGGYAEYALADARFCFRIPEGYSDAAAAPLLCAGLIGYRSLRKTGDAERIGIYGFGAAAHIVTQIARFEGRKVFAFTRKADFVAQAFARSMGAVWAGDSDSAAPEKLDAAIIFAPAGELVPKALRAVERGGCVVCGGIHMSDIPSFAYDDLWHERSIRSVANLTRKDAEEFLALAPQAGVKTEVQTFELAQANSALSCLREGKLSGAAVLVMP